jgi:hypothetical protein
MTKTTITTSRPRLALALMIAAAAAFSGPSTWKGFASQGEAPGRVCSDQTLRGDYGLLASGVRAVPPFLGGGTERFVATAMWTFHGDGTFTFQTTGAGLHGEVTGRETPFPGDIVGTYTVNPNCTGTLQWQPPVPVPPIVYSLVIVDNAREVKAAVMSPQRNIVTVSLTRQ